jgi:hypothetical protein
MPLGWFFQKRKARDLAEELKSADPSDKAREFPWGMIALWAVKLFLWLLARHPNLVHLVLDKFLEFAQRQEGNERYATTAAVSLLRGNVMSHPSTFASVMAKE